MSKSELDQKLQHKPQFVLKIVFFNFGSKKPENLSLKKGHHLTFSGHFFGIYIVIFHKT